MAAKKKTPHPVSPEYARARALGIVEAIQAAASAGHLCLDSDAMDAMAERLGIPVLLIEAAQGHELSDIDALAKWWTAQEAQ